MSKLFTLELVSTDAENPGKTAELFIAPDHGPWFEQVSTWNCPERLVVFFNTRGGSYKDKSDPNLLDIKGTASVGLIAGFDATAQVGSHGVGKSLETLVPFTWRVTDIQNV
jgi:hypothetical protein